MPTTMAMKMNSLSSMVFSAPPIVERIAEYIANDETRMIDDVYDDICSMRLGFGNRIAVDSMKRHFERVALDYNTLISTETQLYELVDHLECCIEADRVCMECFNELVDLANNEKEIVKNNICLIDRLVELIRYVLVTDFEGDQLSFDRRTELCDIYECWLHMS